VSGKTVNNVCLLAEPRSSFLGGSSAVGFTWNTLFDQPQPQFLVASPTEAFIALKKADSFSKGTNFWTGFNLWVL